ncbi:hypothetical protein Hanom_Chr16g01509801 [Helianthus anomalus]
MQMDGPPSLTSVVVRPDSSIEQPIEIHDDGVQAVSIGAMARRDSQPADGYFSYNAPPSHSDVACRHKSHKGESYEIQLLIFIGLVWFGLVWFGLVVVINCWNHFFFYHSRWALKD